MSVMSVFQPQPAYKIYAFDRGWRIMKYVTENLFKRTDIAARWWFTKATDIIRYSSGRHWFVKYWSYVLVAGLYFAGASQYLSAMVLAGLFLALYTILLSIGVGIAVLLIALLMACTFVYSRFYRIFFRCPDCHRDMPIPTFICPSCGERHSLLWPSIYGIVSHRCKNCNTKLPTLNLKIPGYHLMSREQLARICPHCQVQMNTGIGTGTNIHIPIVGGPSTGKSNFIVMATKQFIQMFQNERNYCISFTDEKHLQDYQANIQRLDSGRELVKTTNIVARAYNLKIKAPRALVPKLAYIYDAAGEAFNNSENTRLQEYYKYVDGIIFVIDPCAISAYNHIHQQDIAFLREQLRPSQLDVMQAYERMFQMFEASVGLHKGSRFRHPIAIVVTKVDALNLEYEVGAPAAQFLIQQNPSINSEEEAISILVRNFLCNYGLDNFVRDVELQFANVKYFSCSALGRLPMINDTRSFQPIRAADPLIWLLTQSKVVEPLHGRTGILNTIPLTIKQRT